CTPKEDIYKTQKIQNLNLKNAVQHIKNKVFRLRHNIDQQYSNEQILISFIQRFLVITDHASTNAYLTILDLTMCSMGNILQC
ncbi:hypothetical protein L9F63_011081, partial [Diploptera punctata]